MRWTGDAALQRLPRRDACVESLVAGLSACFIELQSIIG
jgi:hypothetical protein